MKNPRLIVAIITNLLDEAVIVAAIIFGLPRLGIDIPLWGIILICTAFLAYAVIFYKIGSDVLKKKPLLFFGYGGRRGADGRTVESDGFIRAASELWEARAEQGTIPPGTQIIVVSQNGLKLVVRPLSTDWTGDSASCLCLLTSKESPNKIIPATSKIMRKMSKETINRR